MAHIPDEKLRTCQHCENKYSPAKSTSSLKLTWCNTLCEVKDLGFHLKSLENGLYITSEFSEEKESEHTSFPIVNERHDDNEDLVPV